MHLGWWMASYRSWAKLISVPQESHGKAVPSRSPTACMKLSFIAILPLLTLWKIHLHLIPFLTPLIPCEVGVPVEQLWIMTLHDLICSFDQELLLHFRRTCTDHSSSFDPFPA